MTNILQEEASVFKYQSRGLFQAHNADRTLGRSYGGLVCQNSLRQGFAFTDENQRCQTTDF